MFAGKNMQQIDAASLHLLLRGETKYSVVADYLRRLPDSQFGASIRFNDQSMKFYRHGNGHGWVEYGCNVPASVRVENDAVIFRETRIYSDVMRIHGGEHGNTLAYRNYH